MSYCHNCGKEIILEGKFCANCGIKLENTTKALETPNLDINKSNSIILCPYCNESLEIAPKRKKKCPYCGNFIYVRTSPSSHQKILVTEEGIKEIEKEWEKVHFRNDCLRNLKSYGIHESDFIKQKEKLSKKFGFEADDYDVMWSIFNSLILKTKDLHSLKMLYYQMALFLNGTGKNFLKILQESRKFELLQYKKEGIVNVQIITAGKASCNFCQKLHHKKFHIDEAMKLMPIPCEKCTHVIYDNKNGFCRCCYVPTF